MREFDNIELLYLPRATINRIGILAFDAATALEVAAAYVENGYRLLGADGVRLVGSKGIQPSLEHSMDLHRERGALTEREALDALATFLKRHIGSEWSFEIVAD